MVAFTVNTPLMVRISHCVQPTGVDLPHLPRRRTSNLTARVQGKVQKKKERREKKLLRAGFEGRKQGFIGGGGGGAASGKQGAGAGPKK